MRLLSTLFAATLASATILGAQAPAAPTTGATTIILVRHAEKAAEPAADPPLTATGSARADALVEMTKDAGVAAVISTQFARTRATVAPLASKLGLTTEIVDARAPDHARAVAESILGHHRGQVVVVAGHSNTVPAIVAALGAPQPAAICDSEYDNVYIVIVPATGKATVTHARYGAPSPADPACAAMSR